MRQVPGCAAVGLLTLPVVQPSLPVGQASLGPQFMTLLPQPPSVAATTGECQHTELTNLVFE